MTIQFLEIAEAELDDAVRWYAEQAPGLGEAFLIEVLSAADRIARYPDAWHRVLKLSRIRRYQIPRKGAELPPRCSG